MSNTSRIVAPFSDSICIFPGYFIGGGAGGFGDLPPLGQDAIDLGACVAGEFRLARSGVEMIAADGATLSGGERQRVSIGRALLSEPRILLMDEPTKGIDVGTKAEIYQMLGQLASEGKTVVFVSSYLPELLAVCDRIGVMARGELREVRDASDWTEEEVLEAAIV